MMQGAVMGILLQLPVGDGMNSSCSTEGMSTEHMGIMWTV